MFSKQWNDVLLANKWKNLGYLIAASVAFDRATIMEQSSYKILFVTNWVWLLVIVLFCFVIPESPYHIVWKGNKYNLINTENLIKLFLVVSIYSNFIQNNIYCISILNYFWETAVFIEYGTEVLQPKWMLMIRASRNIAIAAMAFEIDPERIDGEDKNPFELIWVQSTKYTSEMRCCIDFVGNW